MRRNRNVVLVALFGIALASDADAQSSARSSEPARLRGTIDLSIGQAGESRDPYIFGAIDGLTMDAQGRIIVADRNDHNVRVFDATGRHLYTIGRKGRGPGDLDTPCCLTIDKHGMLWIKENGNHRYSEFRLGATDATFVRSIRGTTNSAWTADRVDFDPKGRIVDLGSVFVPATKTFRIARLHIDSTGTVERDMVPEPPADSLDSFSFATKSGTASYWQPYGAKALRAFGAGGEMAHAVSSNYAVTWVDALGKRRALLQRAAVAAPELSAKERKSTDELLDAIAKNTGVARAKLPLTIPSRKSPLEALGFDMDGRLWVVRSVADGQPGEADLYDRSGQWIAIMQWPADVTMHGWTVRGRTGIGVAKDEDGAERVVRVQFR